MVQATQMSRERITVPEELESARAKLVYVYLEIAGDASLEEMTDDLDIPAITLCRILHALDEKGIVGRAGGRFVPKEC